MLSNVADPEVLVLRRAARRFTIALETQAMLERTARVEALLHAGGSDPVFLLDEALVAAWPGEAGDPPRREVIWAPESAASEAGLRLSAFDADGRVLLRRTYAASEKPADA